MERSITTLTELSVVAKDILADLSPKDSGATLITLSGELGAGKTALTKAFAKALGVDETVTSPTFVLEKIYHLPEQAAFRRLAHIDAYRLKDGSELAALGFDELMSDRETLVILEWPERVADALPPPTIMLTFLIQEDGTRTLHA